MNEIYSDFAKTSPRLQLAKILLADTFPVNFLPANTLMANNYFAS